MTKLSKKKRMDMIQALTDAYYDYLMSDPQDVVREVAAEYGLKLMKLSDRALMKTYKEKMEEEI